MLRHVLLSKCYAEWVSKVKMQEGEYMRSRGGRQFRSVGSFVEDIGVGKSQVARFQALQSCEVVECVRGGMQVTRKGGFCS